MTEKREGFPEIVSSSSLEEHIELESVTGRFRRDQIESAQAKAEVEALANKRRHMRVATGIFNVRYTQQKKSVLPFGKSKCYLIDASVNGLGIGADKRLKKGELLNITIWSDDKKIVSKFMISAEVIFVGVFPISEQSKRYKYRYGLQFKEQPPSNYTEFLLKETLQRKVSQAVKQKKLQVEKADESRELELEEY